MIYRFVVLAGLLLCPIAYGHEVRPALLDIREGDDGGVEIHWRQPAAGSSTLPLAPVLSAGWLDAPPASESVRDDALTRTWTIPAPRAELDGQTLRIEGLDRTITDVLVRIEFVDGGRLTRIVHAAQPAMTITHAGRHALPLLEYLRLGIGHIWSGLDHLLYVFALILLIGGVGPLVKAITAFTVAHSITLACAALDLVRLRPAPVEAVIALSIVYVAVELRRAHQGQSGLAARAPWLMAFAFGLLHGFGFAGALQSIGLPPGDVAVALLLFNGGIEVGQILFLLVVVAIMRAVRMYAPSGTGRLLRAAPYGIGSVASYWLIARLAVLG